MIHTMSEAEKLRAYTAAKLAVDDAIRRGAKVTYFTGGLSRLEMSIVGYDGEVSVASEYRIQRAVPILYEEDPEKYLGLHDFIVGGKRYELKTSHSMKPKTRFMVNKTTFDKKTCNSDYVILATLLRPGGIGVADASEVDIAGMVPTSEVPTYPYNRGADAYMVPRLALRRVPRG